MTGQNQQPSAIIPVPRRGSGPLGRRAMLQKSAMLAAGFAIPGCFAEEVAGGLVRTASMVEGPFYPDKLPLDTDNDRSITVRLQLVGRRGLPCGNA